MGILKTIIKFPTLSIAVITLYLYWCCFSYETGYLDAFSIPSQYVSINLDIMLDDLSKVLITFITVYMFNKTIRFLMSKSLKKTSLPIEVIDFIALIVSTPFVVYFVAPIPNSFLKYFFIFYFAILFLIALISLVQFKISSKKSSDAKESNPDTIILRNQNLFAVFMLIFLPGMILENLGTTYASRLEHLPLINDSSKLLIVRKYGDQLICKKIPDLGSSDNKVYFLKVSDKPIEIVDYKVGDWYAHKLIPQNNPIKNTSHKIKQIAPPKNKHEDSTGNKKTLVNRKVSGIIKQKI